MRADRAPLFRRPPRGIEWREFLGESYRNVINLIVDALKRPDDGKSFYGRAPVPKDYLNVKAEAHIHAFKAANYIQRPDICAVYQLYPEFRAHASYLESRRASSDDQAHTPCDSGGDLDESMLVGVVYFMQKPKRIQPARRNPAEARMGSLPVPSVVRLQALKECYVGSTDETQRSLPVCPSILAGATAPRPVAVDREAGGLKKGIAGRVARERQLAG